MNNTESDEYIGGQLGEALCSVENIRDQFALAALPAIIAARTALLIADRLDTEGEARCQSVAEQAYAIADDMLTVRERQS